jgi:hypothetical protein
VNGVTVSLGMTWAERFEAGRWLPPREADVVVFLQVGSDCISADATSPNMAGLAAIAQLVSPDVSDRVGQVEQLLRETRAARREGLDAGRSAFPPGPAA